MSSTAKTQSRATPSVLRPVVRQIDWRTPAVDDFTRAISFLHWVGISHYMNLLLIGFMVRSGLEILSAHPKLYWRDDCTPGSEWLRLSRKLLPIDRLWTGTDEETSFSSVIALPGGRNLGMGRHWHFFAAIFWILNGLLYVALLFGTGEWQRLVPTSWTVFPEAARDLWSYLHFVPPVPLPGNPYNSLQQLTYAAVVFLLGPMLLLTGAAMSPGFVARYPWYLRIFGGRQRARSIHFIGLIAVVAFTTVHVALVVILDFPRNMAWIIHGEYSSERTAVWIGLAGLVVVLALHVWATRVSLTRRPAVQRRLGAVIEPVRRALFRSVVSRQHYKTKDVSPYFRVNGYPPTSVEYARLAEAGFEDWRLAVTGLVEEPLELSLADLRALPTSTQTTIHHCIQGWSAIGEWSGVALTEVLGRCRPLATAHYLVLRGFDEPDGQVYYETIDLALARDSQTILAYAMNGAPLPVPHGAPCRLRVETQLGFKMVKYLRSIEVVASYDQIGAGRGGFREDTQFYGQGAGI